jgi:hypothetical protein
MPTQFYARANTNASPLRGKVQRHHFCRTCGIFISIADGKNCMDGYRVNSGCVEGLDPLAVEIRNIDEKSLPLVESGSHS